MNTFSIKDSALILLVTYLFFISIIVLNTGSPGYVYPIDLAFILGIRFALPLLTLIIPTTKITTRLAFYLVTMYLLGYIFPIIHFADVGDILYVFMLIFGLVIMYLISFLCTSRYTQQKSTIIALFIILTAASILLTQMAVSRMKWSAEKYSHGKAYDYLRCEGNNLSPDRFKNICNNITGSFYRPYYQNICLNEAINLKNTGSTSESFQYCQKINKNNIWLGRFTDYFVDYWNLKII